MICVLSAASNERTINRLRACLQSENRVNFWVDDMPSPFWRWRYKPSKCREGYKITAARLDFNTWHMVAVARVPELMPNLSDEMLWQKLSSEKYTTPMLRSWVPWLKDQLLEDGALVKPERFQCEAGWLQLSRDALDDFVSEGIKSGQLEIK